MRFIGSLLLTVSFFSTTLPLQAQNCYLTDQQIREIRFHYDLDRYMVGGCIVGAIFSTINGIMTLSGVTMVAVIPYIATGCSTGFLLGGAGLIVGDFFATPTPTDGKPVLKDTWNKVDKS